MNTTKNTSKKTKEWNVLHPQNQCFNDGMKNPPKSYFSSSPHFSASVLIHINLNSSFDVAKQLEKVAPMPRPPPQITNK